MPLTPTGVSGTDAHVGTLDGACCIVMLPPRVRTRDQLRSLSRRAEKLGAGRGANRLSGYAILISESPTLLAQAIRELEGLVREAPTRELAEVWEQAAAVLREEQRRAAAPVDHPAE